MQFILFYKYRISLIINCQFYFKFFNNTCYAHGLNCSKSFKLACCYASLSNLNFTHKTIIPDSYLLSNFIFNNNETRSHAV